MKLTRLPCVPVGVLCLVLSLATFAMGESRPNIVFIVVDDLGHADIGFNGSTFYETPNVDALAGGGLVIENAYMYPTCSPSLGCHWLCQCSFGARDKPSTGWR